MENYKTLKSAALFERKDKNGNTYYSVSAEMPNGDKYGCLVFYNEGRKDNQPMFKSPRPKGEHKPVGKPTPMFADSIQSEEDVPF